MDKKKLSTKLIKGGISRSKFMETSDALFLTSGFTYKTAEEAEQAFKENKKRFIYSRFGNPTIEAFQKKMAILEEAEEICDRVIVIVEGRIVADSPKSELLDQSGRLLNAFKRLTSNDTFADGKNL